MTTLSGDLLNLDNLNPGSLLDVETKSRQYRIECLGGNQIRVSGHPEYCPDPVPARLYGSIDKQGELDIGLIGRGRRVIFFLNGNRPVTTTRVVKLRLDQPPAAPPMEPAASNSVH